MKVIQCYIHVLVHPAIIYVYLDRSRDSNTGTRNSG
jgi:hypothetical protein